MLKTFALAIPLSMIFMLSSSHGFARADQTCSELISAQEARVAQRVKHNVFTTQRDFMQYRSLLGENFYQRLKTLVESERNSKQIDWIDIGSGEAAAMAPTRFPHPSDLDLKSLHMIAVSPYPAIPLKEIYQRFNQKSGNAHFTYLKKFGQDLPALGLKPTQVITDVFGALTYASRDFSTLIETYGKLLAVGGHAYFNLPIKNISLVDSEGSRVSIITYFDHLAGLKLVEHRYTLMGSGVQLIVELERTEDALSVPPLELIDFKTFSSEVMPFRKYQLSLKGLPVEKEWSAADLELKIQQEPSFLFELKAWQKFDASLSNEARLEVLAAKTEQKNITELNPAFSQTLKDWLGDPDPVLRAESAQFLLNNTHFWIPSLQPVVQSLVRDRSLPVELRIKCYALALQGSNIQPLNDGDTSALIVQYLKSEWVNDLALVKSVLKRLERLDENSFQRLGQWQIYFALSRFKPEVSTLVRLGLYFDFSRMAPEVRAEVQSTLVLKLKEALARWSTRDLRVNQYASDSDRQFLKQSIAEIESKFNMPKDLN